jgi:rod shape-determining protein MreC
LENRRLRALAQSAQMYNAQIEMYRGEVDRLRIMQGFGPIPGKERVLADVIGFAAYENRITLNVGQSKGVRPGMPVEAPEGLVGTVQTVEANRCHVLLITSRSLKIGAVDMDRNPPPAGLIIGENTNSLAVEFQDPKAPVEVGDRVVTSGYSEMIPRGIIIGKVISVDSDEAFGMLRAKVFPAISVGTLREVHVLK